MKQKLVIFDLFGTLTFVAKRPNYSKLALLFKKLKINEGKFRNWEEFVTALFVLQKKNRRKTAKEVAKFFKKHFVAKYYKDVKSVVSLPFKKAILTNAPRFLFSNLSLKQFDQVFTPDKTKFLKPNSRAFLAVLKYFKVSPAESVMVGDGLEKDIMPARNLDMETVLVDRKNSVKNYSGRKIKNLTELKNIFREGL